MTEISGRFLRRVALLIPVGLLALADWTQLSVDSSDLTAKGITAATWMPDLDPYPALNFRPREIKDLQVTLLRPVFSPTRRVPQPKPPPQPPAPTSAPTAPTPPPAPLASADQFQLMGIEIASGIRQALIRSTTAQQGRWLSEGDDFDSWKLTSIGSDAVIVTANGTQSELKLFGADGPPAPK